MRRALAHAGSVLALFAVSLPGGEPDTPEAKRTVRVVEVRVEPSTPGINTDARKALRSTKSRTLLPGIPGLWNGWRLRPDYNPDAVQSDLANLRSFYYQQGYFDARVAAGPVEIDDGKARIVFEVRSGRRYAFHRFTLIGAEGVWQIQPQPDGGFPAQRVCRALFEERRKAERAGVLDFRAAIDAVGATATTRRGPAYRIGRIEFRGNHMFRDSTIRRSLLLDEGEPLDRTLLRESLGSLNRTGLFEPLNDNSIVVNAPRGSDRADVTIRLQERKMRHWFVSGPVGPMSVAGPLQLAIGSRLPPWGRSAFELATYSVSINFILFPKPLGSLLPFLPNKRFITLLSIERPSLPGQRVVSGFTVAPQFGWQGLAASYGMSQTRTLLSPLLQTGRDFQPALPVTIERVGSDEPGGAGVMYCTLPKTKLDWARQIAGTAVSAAFSFVPF